MPMWPPEHTCQPTQDPDFYDPTCPACVQWQAGAYTYIAALSESSESPGGGA